MKIGELAKRAHCQVETVRYYEREGLLAAPARSEGNYRLYQAQHLERLLFIRNCRTLDMTLDEVRSLLTLMDDPQQSCEQVNQLIDAHIGHVQTRVSNLQQLQQQLIALRQSCSSEQGIQQCGILQQLNNNTVGPAQTECSHVGKSHL
jgi:Cd(II)/Pb(II)-responsive transcriptional regulator